MSRRSVATIAAAMVTVFGLRIEAETLRLVNMIPEARSGETNQDAEPTVAVDPLNPSLIAGSAFTWDNLSGNPMVTATAPIYVSSNRGASWSLAFVVPSKVGAPFPTLDITLSFAADKTTLYGGVLSTTTYPQTPLAVLRTPNPLVSTIMVVLDTQSGKVDQPHTIALSAATGSDKLYVGFNNFDCVAPGRSAKVDGTQSAAIGKPTFLLHVVEARNTPCQDGFATVPAAHADGTVYVAFFHDWSGTPRVTVVRDDNWGSGASPFTALKDLSDNSAGRLVTGALRLPSGVMGQNRLGASNLSVAIDPRSSKHVYVAWGDSGAGGANTETIHVRRSTNRGVDWSSSDLLTVTNALNPEIAINARGTVGVLYQRFVSGRWETHFVRTSDADGTVFSAPGIVLANQDATIPASVYDPYIGDYASLISVGNNFFGMFSASNYPDRSNFAQPITYARYVDWTTHKLYADSAHKTEVAPSIDPFFFEVNLD